MGSWSSSLCIFILLPLLLLFNVRPSHSFNSAMQTKCHKKERNALLEFKANLYNESCKSYVAYLKTWTVEGKNGDCCNWAGVVCDEYSGHVINLHLDDSCLSGSIDSSSSIFKLDHLQRLDLSRNDFRQSKIPSAICNLSRLESLKLKESNFSGQIPSEVLHLSNLSYLDLSNNYQLILKNPSLSDLGQSLIKLEQLYLAHVEIPSSIPDSLFRLTSLRYLSLSSSKMHGQIPPSVSNLTELEWIELSYNQFTGQIHLDVFLQIDSLTFLDLSYNNFSLVLNNSIRPRSELGYLHLASLNLRSFPLFLQKQYYLYSLDLSSNNISGEVPQWFMDVGVGTLTYLNLSHNHLSRFEADRPLLKWSLGYLDLGFNQLKGSLPLPPKNSPLDYYSVSSNHFSGELPKRICDFATLSVLDIGNNNLSGIIPQCLANLNISGNLSVLNLPNNNFSGPIPPIGKNSCRLKMIDISYNQFEGPVPRDIENCTDLEFLNLGNNKINDVFPFWLSKLPALSVLILRSNRFRGVIDKPSGGYMFPKLQIINLSDNYFTGCLSARYFEGWMAMKVGVNKKGQIMSYASYEGGPGSYFYTVTLTDKGINIEYTKIPESLIGVDLSSNYLTGEIPTSIAILKGLHFLNISNNMLTGSIPFYLNGLANLESLDLSHNKLSGEIPEQLTDLTALESFDVSFNQLTGPIPQSKQFNTFENSSYQGNPGLCGLPLSRKCGNSIGAPPPPSFKEDHASRTWFKYDWKIVSMGYTTGFVIGAFTGMKWTRGCRKVKRIRQVRFVLD